MSLFAEPRVVLEQRDDGNVILRSPEPLRPYARCIGEWLVAWADRQPDRPFLCERPDNDVNLPWRVVTYGEVLRQIEAIGTWMLRAELTAACPLAVLSDNGIEHALLSIAAAHVGVPIASVSPAYSLLSKDHAKLKTILRQLSPGAIYVSDIAPFAAALAAVRGDHRARLVTGRLSARESADAVPFAALLANVDHAAVAHAFATVGPDTVAKILFTSGSTGQPKGVINTERMLCASQEAKAQIWPFLAEQPPVILDWLPWSHTFGANHNFNLILRHGGTLYIDGGKPAPGLFPKTLRNLRAVAATIHFNVPRGYDMLVPELKKDAALRRAFFRDLRVIFYAAAALPQNLWDDLAALAEETTGRPLAMVSAWGATETSPLATDCYYQAERSGVIGLPVPGTELKLVPNAGKQEIRVRGPNVTPGYWHRPELTAAAFDAEGFYVIGDAVRFVDAKSPEKGLVFDGRIAEDFKLMSGTWVNVATLRVRGIEYLTPIAQDIVVTGHDREEIGFLVFCHLAQCRQLARLPEDAPAAAILAHPAVIASVRAGLAQLKADGGGSSTYAARAVLMAEAPSADAGEITDKGYINQRAVLERRAALVDGLYAEPLGVDVIAI